MSIQPSPEAVEKIANLSIHIRGKTIAQNTKETAMELFARASRLDEAIDTLKLPYTYEIMTGDAKKIAARRQLGGMSAEILETMRDELYSAGTKAWRLYETLSHYGEGGDRLTPIPPQEQSSEATSSS
jgi:hypothetical protein